MFLKSMIATGVLLMVAASAFASAASTAASLGYSAAPPNFYPYGTGPERSFNPWDAASAPAPRAQRPAPKAPHKAHAHRR